VAAELVIGHEASPAVHLRRAKALELTLGTGDTHRELIATALLGGPEAL
jgi:hypothetical protein